MGSMAFFQEESVMSFTRLIFVLTVSIFLSACTNDEVFIGVGGTGLNEIDYKIKQLSFSWPSVSGADTYRLLENPDGVSGYIQIDGDFPSTTTSFDHDIAVHLQDWTNASYILQSCVSGDCTDSAPRFATDSSAAIGYFKASNTGLNDTFGQAVAVSDDGNTVAVGAWAEDSDPAISETDDNLADSGAVYIFTRVADDWQGPVLLKASNAGSDDHFGFSVALSSNGNTLAVGARNEASGVATDPTNNLATGAGAVYIFVRDANGDWTEEAYIKASNVEADDNFGWMVALSNDGNVLAVGAPGEDGEAVIVRDSGAAYTFTRNGTVWSQQDYVKASDAASGDSFGSALSLNAGGTLLAVGAPLEDGTNSNNGAAYIFSFGGSVWNQTAVLRASNSGDTDNFGTSVALSSSGTSLVVGAPFEDSDALGNNENVLDSGAAYVFVDNGSWVEQAMIKSATARAFDRFGISVAIGSINGDIVVVGSDQEDGAATGVGGDPQLNTAFDSGAAYVFTRDAGSWSQHAYLKSSNTGFTDHFGGAMAMSGDGQTLAIGAIGEDSDATGIGGDQGDGVNSSDSGAVYLY